MATPGRSQPLSEARRRTPISRRWRSRRRARSVRWNAAIRSVHLCVEREPMPKPRRTQPDHRRYGDV